MDCPQNITNREYERIRRLCISEGAELPYQQMLENLAEISRETVRSPANPHEFMNVFNSFFRQVEKITMRFAYLDTVHLTMSRSRLSVLEAASLLFAKECVTPEIIDQVLDQLHNRAGSVTSASVLWCIDTIISGVIRTSKCIGDVLGDISVPKADFFHQYLQNLEDYIVNLVHDISCHDPEHLQSFPEHFLKIRNREVQLAKSIFDLQAVPNLKLYARHYQIRGLNRAIYAASTVFQNQVNNVLHKLVERTQPYIDDMFKSLMDRNSIKQLQILYQIYEDYNDQTDETSQNLDDVDPEKLDLDEDIIVLPGTFNSTKRCSVLLGIFAFWLSRELTYEKQKLRIEYLHKVREKAIHIIKHCFKGNHDFIREIDKAFSKVIVDNKLDINTECVKYIDKLIQNISSDLEKCSWSTTWFSENQKLINEQFAPVYWFFLRYAHLGFVNSFMKIYKIFLSRRLLQQNSLLSFEHIQSRVLLERIFVVLLTKDFRKQESDICQWFWEWSAKLGILENKFSLDYITEPRTVQSTRELLGEDSVVLDSITGEWYFEGIVFDDYSTAIDDNKYSSFLSLKLDSEEVLENFASINRMLRDVEKSRNHLDFDKFSSVVLSKDIWPNFDVNNFKISVPPQLDYQGTIMNSTKIYFNKVSADKYHEVVTWNNSLSYVSLNYYPATISNSVILNTSIIIASVLLQFENFDQLRYEQVVDLVQLSKNDVEKFVYEKNIKEHHGMKRKLDNVKDPEKLVLRSLQTLVKAGLLLMNQDKYYKLNGNYTTTETEINLSIISLKKLDLKYK